MKFTLLFCILVLVTASPAAPSAIQVVDRQTAAPGLAVYCRTDNYLLARPQVGTAGRVISLDPDVPTYLAYLREPDVLNRISPVATALFTDGRNVLVQLDEAGMHKALAAGAELVRLPERPHPFLAGPGRKFPQPAFTDTFILRLVSMVSPDSVRRQVQRLQDFRTRFSPAESCRAAEQYAFDYFTALGMDSVELDTYQWQGITMRNVIGTRLGRRSPEKIAIVCGHMDSYSQSAPMDTAPGAEDNASGTAVAFEAARILAREDLDKTVKFIAFTGEELGLIGSFHYAEEMRTRNADITGVLNFDMIAWPGGRFGVSIFCDAPSLGLAQMQGDMADRYTSMEHDVVIGTYGSDQLAFHEYGYPATAGAEYGSFYPYYHSTADTIGHLSMPLAAEVVKMAVAGLVTLTEAPDAPDSFRLWDAGTGGALEATWFANTEPDLAGYRLMWGQTPGSYTDSLLVGRVTRQRITGLENGRRHYATLIALDSAGHESGLAPEQSAIPGIQPLAPSGIAAQPSYFGMSLSWLRNIELDLAGYNIYRSTVSGTGYVRLNQSLVTDTCFRDSGLASDTTYYYVITAVDSSLNEGPRSIEASGKPITLDHGILLVDETRDGSGQRGSPSDAQQDAFYHLLLAGTRLTDWDVQTDSIPLAGDIGPYSTIVWHADDYSQQRIHPAVPGLANYLSHGGQLWLVGWKPMMGIAGGSRYPFTFSAGEFCFDYLGLAGAGQAEKIDFTGATGQAGYPSIALDSTKLFASFQGKLPFVDVLYPDDAEAVLTYISASGDSFQGRPVGTRRLSLPGRVVCFGFPLYYTNESEARILARKVLDDLGEPYGIEERTNDRAARTKPLPTVVRGVLNLQPAIYKQESEIALFDISGGRVRDLRPGENDLRRLASGVYFVRAGNGKGTFVTRLNIVR